MKDWKSLLYEYLELSQLPLLEGKGKISSIEAKTHEIKSVRPINKKHKTNLI